MLDGFLLLASGGSPSPDHAICANLSSLNLVDIAEEDLAFFVNLDRLDVSDNQLNYEQVVAQMNRLPRLSSLNLACNSIASLQVPAGTLRTLQTLDLSFNELHGDVLMQLAHLPGLVTLNLSSNCISSVPPEEDLYGLAALKELILDSNDLVQFVQWRALDALPRLRKLSLASNRVKRLKDDAPDTAMGNEKLSYFPELEELNLSNNEIMTVEALPALLTFHALVKLNLSDNPCVHGKNPPQRLGRIHVLCEKSKPWYLRGNGAHKVRPKASEQEPKVNFAKKKMKKVSSSPALIAGKRPKAIHALGVYDAEANQLLLSLGPPRERARASSPRLVEPADEEEGDSFALTRMPPERGGVRAPAQVQQEETAAAMLGDDLSEQELRSIFRERKEQIDKRFEGTGYEPAEPPSFMRQIPFQMSSAAGQKIFLKGRLDEEEISIRPTSSTAFLTGVGEDGMAPNDSIRRGRDLAPSFARKESLGASGPIREPRGLGMRLQMLGMLGGDGASDLDDGMSNASGAAATKLPTIRTASRGSSAGLGGRGAGAYPADFDQLMLPAVSMGPLGAGAFGKRRPMPDVGVREAMRALRAAAKSEHMAMSIKVDEGD